VNYLVFEEIL